MKAVRKVERKYYKYVETEFVQPVLTSNGTYGVTDFSLDGYRTWGGYFYYAFDGSTSTFWETYQNANNQYICWYTIKPLKISSIDITNHSSGGWGKYITAGTLYGSNDGTNWEEITTFTNSLGEGQTWTINVDSDIAYHYHKLQETAHTGDTVRWCEFKIIGVNRVIQEATKDDYDYYMDEPVYKLPKKVERKYYKYVETEFVQPVLTSNGTLGGDSFAVYASTTWGGYPAYQACDNNENTHWLSTLTGRYNTAVTSSITNPNSYTYYKIDNVSRGSHGWNINELTISAKERVIQEATQDNYNYYKDVPIYYAVNK